MALVLSCRRSEREDGAYAAANQAGVNHVKVTIEMLEAEIDIIPLTPVEYVSIILRHRHET